MIDHLFSYIAVQLRIIMYVCMCVCVWGGAIPVAALSKVYVCDHLVAGIANSNPAESMDVCLLCLVIRCVVLCR
jgi:hypothetical protein